MERKARTNELVTAGRFPPPSITNITPPTMSFESYPTPTQEGSKEKIPESLSEQIISEIESSPSSRVEKNAAIKKFEELQRNKEFIVSLRARINTIEASFSTKPEEREAAYENLASSTAKALFEK